MATLKTLTRFLFGAYFIAAGANHFINPAFYIRMMPAYLPWHAGLVGVSGVAEPRSPDRYARIRLVVGSDVVLNVIAQAAARGDPGSSRGGSPCPIVDFPSAPISTS